VAHPGDGGDDDDGGEEEDLGQLLATSQGRGGIVDHPQSQHI